jgi:formylglycine-generating enzyme required for sulfatase activity
LGEFGVDRLSPAERANLLPRLLQLYRDDPDPGMHGAAEWLLRQWKAADKLRQIDKGLATGKVTGKRHWYINRQGQTMVIVAPPGVFWMGEGEEKHRERIDRRYAIAAKKVTVEQFRKFFKGHRSIWPHTPGGGPYAPTGDCPVHMVSWFMAAEYCNWLSGMEGIPKGQWCYLPNPEGKYAVGMRMAPDYLQRTGYRLPTEAEWEYACRAGSVTGWSFGEAEELVGKYAWHIGNSLGRSHPVGSLKPNGLGLFDMHGNCWEWSQGIYKNFKGFKEWSAREDKEEIDDIKHINSVDSRGQRGGSFNDRAVDVRFAPRYGDVPTRDFLSFVGFRPARTFTP